MTGLSTPGFWLVPYPHPLRFRWSVYLIYGYKLIKILRNKVTSQGPRASIPERGSSGRYALHTVDSYSDGGDVAAPATKEPPLESGKQRRAEVTVQESVTKCSTGHAHRGPTCSLKSWQSPNFWYYDTVTTYMYHSPSPVSVLTK